MFSALALWLRYKLWDAHLPVIPYCQKLRFSGFFLVSMISLVYPQKNKKKMPEQIFKIQEIKQEIRGRPRRQMMTVGTAYFDLIDIRSGWLEQSLRIWKGVNLIAWALMISFILSNLHVWDAYAIVLQRFRRQRNLHSVV